MNFDVNEQSQEKNKKNKEINNKLSIIIPIIIALVVGISVFLITNSVFNKKETKKEPVKTSEELSLNDENVKLLYNYVTIGYKNNKEDKFAIEKNVNLETFSNTEKYYYALQFVNSKDLEPTEKVDDQKRRIYLLSEDTIKEYMEQFFGSTITYTTEEKITYPFNFTVNDKNIGTMTYSKEDKGYKIVFGESEEKEEDNLVKSYYSSLENAKKEIDGTYILEAKIIYTQIDEEGENYRLSIYKDYEKTSLIEYKSNQTKEMLQNEKIDLENYKSSASTITYTFKSDGKKIYFYSSSIKN